MDAFDQLTTSKLFVGLSDPERESLRPIVSFLRRDRGSIVFMEGDPAEGFFILLSGRVRIYKTSPDGREYTLHQITPGQVFAEAAIFDGRGYPANCAALEGSTMAFVPRREFTALLARHPQIALKIISALSAWLREFTRKLEELSLKEVPARLAAYLVDLSRKAGSLRVTLDSSKTELAARLGTISATLSRSLKKLSSAGVIAVDGSLVDILDLDRLSEIAAGGRF